MSSTPTTYGQTRRLLVLGGTVLLAGIALLAWFHGVDPVEATGAAFYIPVFLAAALLGPWEGAAAGVVASIAYLALRIPAIKVVGFGSLAGILVPRVASYIVFGAVIGLAARRLNTSLSHLERHDQVDAATGLHNAHWLLEALAAETSRVQRALDPVRGFTGYGSVFSLVVASLPGDAFRGRDGTRLLRQAGAELSQGLRTSDRPVHATGQRHLFALLLTGTGAEGAGIVEGRVLERLRRLLGDRAGDLMSTVITYPDNADALRLLTEELGGIDAAQRMPARRGAT